MEMTDVKEKYFENWPLHYYEIQDADKRSAALDKVLSENPDSKDDLLRQKYLKHRFYTINQTGKTDVFARAWVELLVDGKQGVSFLTKRSMQKRVGKVIPDLFLDIYPTLPEDEQKIIRDEWMDYAEDYINSLLGSRQYKSYFYGIVALKNETVLKKIVSELKACTKELPEKLGYGEQFAPFYEVCKEAFGKVTDRDELFV